MEDLHEMYEAAIMHRVDWHCPGRHGVVRNVEKKDQNIISNAIIYFYGSKGQWWKQSEGKAKGVLDVEFVHMTKVFPPPRKPWEWCGTTILFEDWKKQEDDNRRERKKFKVGMMVSFSHKGQTISGVIAGLNKRAKVVVPGDLERWWNVPYDLLTVQ